MSFLNILFVVLAISMGIPVGFYLLGRAPFNEKAEAAKRDKLLHDTKKQNESLVVAARQQAEQKKDRYKTEEEKFTAHLAVMEKMVESKQAAHQKREMKLAELRRALSEEEKSVQILKQKVGEDEASIVEKLGARTGFDKNRVKEQVIAAFEQEFKNEADMRVQQTVEWTQESAAREAKTLIAHVTDRFAGGAAHETEEAVITVPRDEVKGKIIGRGGRAIAFFETLFGVDVIFNDEPNVIKVSGFNLVQREVARVALSHLIREKLITEEIIKKTKIKAEQEVEKLLLQEGERALKAIGVANVPPDFVKLVGRLKFRTSYGQNIMQHSMEVGYFARLLASEIGANIEVAFLGGFFHDIGKAVDQEVGGSHDVLSKEILEKYNFSWEITHAAWTHHNAIPQETVEARIVQAADAISASRPGARAESLERYLTKIHDLQDAALSFEGVKKAFAINAGRELRVVVEPEKISDQRTRILASEIAAKVQEKGGYPGKIKIVTVRTTKATEHAK